MIFLPSNFPNTYTVYAQFRENQQRTSQNIAHYIPQVCLPDNETFKFLKL